MAELSSGMLMLAAFVAAAVEVLLVVSVVRTRGQVSADAEGKAAPQPSVWAEGLWTLLPAFFLLLLFLEGIRTLNR